ncbi:MAG: aminoglycoside phosphotransferase (APT) family kinase protein [Natrialbaceae archaeon]|jgi:aminoglycoside phosphotransferase (APT) family kinase protein
MSGNDDIFGRIVDEQALRERLERELGPAETFEVSRHQAGHSNETLFITWGDESLVVRRPPVGATADSAHDILREYRVMDALQETSVRVPRTEFACEDHAVMGCDFYVMERLDGDVLRQMEPSQYRDPESRQRIGEELVDRLVEIHAVDYEAAGLAELGRPEGYTQRQVERWHKQLDWAVDATADERELPFVDEITTWLDGNVPESSPQTLVHGDYKLDNVMFNGSTPPEIISVLDWEMGSLGDPLTDLGWLLLFWHDPEDSEPAVPALMPSFTEHEGYPSKQDLVDRYERRSGRQFENQQFYRVLAAYKLLGICEMFFRRHLEGETDDQLYPKMRNQVPTLAEHTSRIIDGEMPL